MKTLYEILEVSEKASKEIIEKAYKVLAKKYHPDLQKPENKANAENKMKEINEAYEVLGDEEKRKSYDAKLENERKTDEQLHSQTHNQQSVTSQYQQPYYKQENQSSSKVQSQAEQRYRDMQKRRYEEELRKQQEQMRKTIQEDMERQAQNAYYNYLRSLGYKIKERWTWQKTKKLLLILLIIAMIAFILWLLPPTHNMMMEIYNNNKLIKIFVDIIVGIVTALFKTIASIFTGT